MRWKAPWAVNEGLDHFHIAPQHRIINEFIDIGDDVSLMANSLVKQALVH
jgi:hypothetical protein